MKDGLVVLVVSAGMPKWSPKPIARVISKTIDKPIATHIFLFSKNIFLNERPCSNLLCLQMSKPVGRGVGVFGQNLW